MSNIKELLLELRIQTMDASMILISKHRSDDECAAQLKIIEAIESQILALCIPQWIKVEERLPIVGQSVILSQGIDFGGDQFPGYLGNDKNWHKDNHNGKLSEVTHWQPLPSPPSKD